MSQMRLPPRLGVGAGRSDGPGGAADPLPARPPKPDAYRPGMLNRPPLPPKPPAYQPGALAAPRTSGPRRVGLGPPPNVMASAVANTLPRLPAQATGGFIRAHEAPSSGSTALHSTGHDHQPRRMDQLVRNPAQPPMADAPGGRPPSLQPGRQPPARRPVLPPARQHHGSIDQPPNAWAVPPLPPPPATTMAGGLVMAWPPTSQMSLPNQIRPPEAPQGTRPNGDAVPRTRGSGLVGLVHQIHQTKRLQKGRGAAGWLDAAGAVVNDRLASATASTQMWQAVDRQQAVLLQQNVNALKFTQQQRVMVMPAPRVRPAAPMVQAPPQPAASAGRPAPAISEILPQIAPGAEVSEMERRLNHAVDKLRLSASTVAVAQQYLQRLMAAPPAGQLPHELAAGALVLAAKYTSDYMQRMPVWAQVTGLREESLRSAEQAIHQALNYNLSVGEVRPGVQGLPLEGPKGNAATLRASLYQLRMRTDTPAVIERRVQQLTSRLQASPAACQQAMSSLQEIRQSPPAGFLPEELTTACFSLAVKALDSGHSPGDIAKAGGIRPNALKHAERAVASLLK